MKKFLKVVLVGGILLVVLAGAGGYVLFTRLVKESKPTLEAYAGDAIGSKVELGDLSAAILPGAAVSISSLSASNPDNDEKLNLGALRLAVDVMPLTRGELAFSGVALDAPEITLLMEKEGLRVAGIPRKKSADSGAAGSTATTLPVGVNIQQLKIHDGRVVFRDPGAKTSYALGGLNVQSAVRMDQGNLALSNAEGSMALLDQFDVVLAAKQASVNPETSETTIEGGTVTLLGQSLTVDGAIQPGNQDKQLTVRSESIALDEVMPALAAYLPALSQVSVSGAIKPDLHVALGKEGASATGTAALDNATLQFGSYKLEELTGTADLDLTAKRQKLAAKALTAQWNGIPLTMGGGGAYSGKQATVDHFDLAAFGGKASASGGVEVGETLPFTFDGSVSAMQLNELLEAFAPELPLAIKGTLTRFDLDLQGRLSGDIRNSLKGNGTVLLEDGLLEQVNLAALVLDAVKGLPFLAGSLMSKVPPKLRDQLDKNYTILSRVEGTYTLADGRMHSEDLKVDGELFNLAGKGSVGFDRSADMKCVLTFNPEFSTALAETVPELANIYDPQGQFVVPLTLGGTLPDVTVRPDLDALLKQGVKDTLKKKATEEINKLLGGDQKEVESSGDTPAETPKEKAKSLLKGLLN